MRAQSFWSTGWLRLAVPLGMQYFGLAWLFTGCEAQSWPLKTKPYEGFTNQRLSRYLALLLAVISKRFGQSLEFRHDLAVFAGLSTHAPPDSFPRPFPNSPLNRWRPRPANLPADHPPVIGRKALGLEKPRSSSPLLENYCQGDVFKCAYWRIQALLGMEHPQYTGTYLGHGGRCATIGWRLSDDWAHGCAQSRRLKKAIRQYIHV
jgi:hypothetical protein